MKSFCKEVSFIFYMIGSMFKTIKLKFLKKFSSKDKYEAYVNKSVYNWAKFIVNLIGIKLNVIGIENLPNEACLFVSNHQSNLDVPCLITAINKPMGFISKKELSSVPVISTWMKAIHSVFMDRQNVRESLKSILEGAKVLKDGYSMVIFPEGTRSKGKPVAEFKKGSMKLGIKAGVKIVPIAIDGTYKSWECSESGKFSPSNVNIIICKPIDVSELDKDQKNTLADDIRSTIVDAIENNKK